MTAPKQLANVKEEVCNLVSRDRLTLELA